MSLLRQKCRLQKTRYQGYPFSVRIVMKVVSQNVQFLGQYLYLFVYIFINNIQGDSGGICIALENDSMCDSKQKSSYEHGSDFERLPRYGKKKIMTILRARTAIT